MLDIDKICVTDHNKFWDCLKKLGPRKKHNIPLEIYKDKSTISCNLNEVLDKWKNDFESLYSASPKVTGSRNANGDEQTGTYISSSEPNILTDLEYLNADITYQEVKKVVLNTKSNKASGIDKIPYDVLKNENIIKVLTNLFQMCFNFGIIPQVWLKALIVPIPKNKDDDPRIPLNYRGISLLNCVFKIYSMVLNSRLTKSFEENNLFTNEQNDFRSKRSCLDHIFSLTEITKNRTNRNESTFAAFIDFCKAFDCVD